MDTEDLGQLYVTKSTGSAQASDAQAVEEWYRSFQADQGNPRPPLIEPVDTDQKIGKGRPLPEAPPARIDTEDPLGQRAVPEDKQGTVGKVVRNVAEIPGQALAGVNDAVENAFSLFDNISGGTLGSMTNWLNDNVANLDFNVVPAARTGTGEFTRKVTEFLTGFVTGSKYLKGVGVTNAAVKGVGAGMIADFVTRNPYEGRLADLWNDIGLPKNVLTEYLHSNPDDAPSEARFKNTLEGAGLGVLAEGIFRGARLLRNLISQPGVKEAEDVMLKARYGEITDAEFSKFVGDPSKPGIEIRTRKPSVAGEKVKTAMEGGPDLEPRALIRRSNYPEKMLPENFEVYINFAAMDTPEKIKFAIGKMAEASRGQIDDATRGVVSQKETERLADAMGMSVTDLLQRRKGQAFNAEEALAARQLWVTSGEQLVDAAKAAAKANASPLDHFAFRKMMAVHSAIQNEVLGARAEAGRALNSWKIDAKGGIERARAIQQVMGAMGGPEASAEMARRIAILAEVGDPAALARIAEKGAGAATADAIKEVWVNGLLSSPKTHVVNTTSNTLVAFQQIYERMAAGGIRQLVGGEGVEMMEGLAMTHGMVESVKDAFRAAAKSLKTGETGYAFNKIDLPHPNALSADALQISKGTGLGRFVDFLGTATNVPGRLLGAEDEFFRTIGYRMNVRAEALRTATQEGLAGEKMLARYKELVDNPSEAIRINAADAALYQTFTNETGAFGRWVMGARNVDGWMGFGMNLVLPFVRTPVNIARYSFERTPFAPLVGQWRADIAAGGARADLALARMSTGTAIMLAAMDMADRGIISGDGPRGQDKEVREALQRQGWQPYSVKVGDRWHSYNRMDPFGMTMGFAASITEAVKKGEIDQDQVDEWWEVTAMAIAAVSQVTVSKTYLEGFAKAIEVVSDPKRYSKQYVQDLFASFLPATSLSNAVKNVVDPVQREAETPMEAVQARIAGLSDKLTPRRDLWGREISSESGLGKAWDFLTPSASKQQVDSPIDREIVRLGQGPDRINKRSSFGGVQANFRFWPKAYDDYVKLAGNDLKHPAWNMGAKDFLDAVVTGKHPLSAAWNVMSDESQRDFIRSSVSEYRKLAQQHVLQMPEHRGFAQEIERLQEINRGMKMPVLEGQQ